MNTTEPYHCNLCGYSTDQPDDDDLGEIRGNTEKYLEQTFSLWRCSQCETIHSLVLVDFPEMYSDYPLNHLRKLDIYARQTLGNLLRRLCKGGIHTTSRILDYGSGNGILSTFLQQKGYSNVESYDPYVEPFTKAPDSRYDLVVLNDVLEHVDDPGALLDTAARLVQKGGLLYVGTADSAGVGSMKALEKHRMRLHQPFHRKIITLKKLRELGRRKGFHELSVYTRSYMDTVFPFGNYRFLDEYCSALDHNMDRALNPESAGILIKKPKVLFYAFFGYFFPSADEPAVLWIVK